MGKEKKSLGIKTTRYYTKDCSKCGFEYPNWFTNCPKCGAAWDELVTKSFATHKETHKKTVKIVVKITEEDFNKTIKNVNLIFSADEGKSWYQMKMDKKIDYYIAEIAEIPIGSVIIYYIEVFLEDGEKIIENNDNQYYYYKVGFTVEEAEEKPSEKERKKIEEEIKKSPIKPQKYYRETKEPKSHISKKMIEQSTKTPEQNIQSSQVNDSKTPLSNNITIFGKPQTKIDPELKICSHCNSKIKKMWSICPICGKSL
ncbi:MAG: hypothetical protein ACFFHD_12130 [Promethearchaeota archaeon]